MSDKHHDDSGVFDLRALMARRPDDGVWWAEIARPEPPPRPRRAAGWLLATHAGIATAVLAAVALAAQPAAPTPMTLQSAEALAARAPTLEIVAIPRATPRPAPAARRPRRPAARPTPRAAPEAERAPSPGGPAHSWETGGRDAPERLERSVDALLEQAVGDEPEDPRPTRAVSLPDAPTRRQISTTLRALEGEVGTCGEGDVTVRLVIEGATGRVRSATASGAGVSSAVTSCVAGVVRSARFPRFERERFVVAFPYRL